MHRRDPNEGLQTGSRDTLAPPLFGPDANRAKVSRSAFDTRLHHKAAHRIAGYDLSGTFMHSELRC